jgi:hypothetical protein
LCDELLIKLKQERKMAEHVTSYIEKREKQMELPVGERPVITLTDLLYLVKSAGGSRRDGIFTVEEFAEFLGSAGHLGPLDIRKTIGEAAYITKVDGDKVKVYASGPSGTSTKYLELGFDSDHNVCRLKLGDDAGNSYVEVTDGTVKVSKARPDAGPLVTEFADDGSIRIRSYNSDGTTVGKFLNVNLDDVMTNEVRSTVPGLSIPHWIEVMGSLMVGSLQSKKDLTVNGKAKLGTVGFTPTFVATGSTSLQYLYTQEPPTGYTSDDFLFDGSMIAVVNGTDGNIDISGLGSGNLTKTMTPRSLMYCVYKTDGNDHYWYHT